ncbi:MAG: PspA/IM30 family protein [Nevskia sp.]|nr:PspA/IM30 family protein [Nevskia sp.]
MATLFSRIRRLVTAEAHEAVDHIEDPRAMSHQVVRDLINEFAAANRGLVAALGAQRQLQRSRERMNVEAADWESKAEALLRRGEEGLTREAVQRAVLQRQGATALEQPLEHSGRTVERLRAQAERLQRELERARQRVTLIDVQQAASRALRGAGAADDAYSRAFERGQELDRYERRAEIAVCRDEAAAELLDRHDRFERDVARLAADAAVEEALAALRRRVAALPADASVGPSVNN